METELRYEVRFEMYNVKCTILIYFEFYISLFLK